MPENGTIDRSRHATTKEECYVSRARYIGVNPEFIFPRPASFEPVNRCRNVANRRASSGPRPSAGIAMRICSRSPSLTLAHHLRLHQPCDLRLAEAEPARQHLGRMLSEQ